MLSQYFASLRGVSLRGRSKNFTVAIPVSITLQHLYVTSVTVNGCVATDKPDLSCEPEWSGRLGQTNYEITCTGHMNPGPQQVVWQWNSATDGETEIHNEVINQDHLAEVVPVFDVFALD